MANKINASEGMPETIKWCCAFMLTVSPMDAGFL